MAGKFLCPRCFELQSHDSIEYICSNMSTTSKCQHAIDRMPQHPANAKKPVCEECGQPLVTKVCPKCGGEILVKKSRRGKVYYGCEHSPKCDFMVWDMPVKDEACPQCGGLLLKKQGRNGKIFCYNEDCKYERKLKDEKK